MKFVIDTSAYSASERDEPIVRKWFSTQHHLLVPIIVIAELHAGFANGNKQKANEELLEGFLASPFTDILFITEQTAHLYAGIYLALKRAGTPINTNDMWIAALALEHNLPLLTLDQDFENIKNLKLL